MASVRFLAAALLLQAMTSAPAAAKGLEGQILRTGCRQGECAWLKVRRVETVKSVRQGRLVRLTARAGTSIHLDGNIPAGPAHAGIQWERADRADYAFCSTRRPAFAFPGNHGGLIVHFLDLYDLGGYQMTSASLYMRLCHGRPGLPSAGSLRALGYRPGSRSDQVQAAGVEVMTRF
jgi:hypothetical protein